MELLRIRGGRVIGRQHSLAGKNCQDAHQIYEPEITKPLFGEPKVLRAGILSDGCGSAKTSEVGANLIVQRMVSILCESKVARLCQRWSLEEIVDHIEDSTYDFLNELSRGWWQTPFVQDNLLATILGFVTDGKKMVIFSSGDGTIFLDDDVLVIDEDNTPSYFAYRLFEKQVSFKRIEVDLQKVQRVAIASDGFEPELINEFWGKEHPNGVQRLLNVYSKKKHFLDDATLITLEKIQPEGG